MGEHDEVPCPEREVMECCELLCNSLSSGLSSTTYKDERFDTCILDFRNDKWLPYYKGKSLVILSFIVSCTISWPCQCAISRCAMQCNVTVEFGRRFHDAWRTIDVRLDRDHETLINSPDVRVEEQETRKQVLCRKVKTESL